MPNSSFDGLPQFLSVAEHGSFAAAAQRLGISPSAVSQAVRGLETRLGVRLFNRTTRSVALTEAGLHYLERVGPALRDIESAEEAIGDTALRPKGKLRLNALRAGHMIVIQPILQRFLRAYPEIEVEVVVEAGLIDIVRDGFDAGIRFGDVIARDMIGVPVGPKLTAHVIASPAYIAEHGVPQHPNDLLAHDCIGFRHLPSGQIERWEFEKAGERLAVTVSGRLVFNDSALLVQSALDGLGIAYMINGYIEQFLADGRLVRLLPDWSPALAGFTLYYPDRKRVPRKLRALIDFLRADKGNPVATEAVLA
ncbi:MAG TPA: LysR family transcriptional regulator [Acidocella sp.]|jgi:DNA-binding transcriptional LysR family regulator|uniref:LysR family transcriptional regulator n=1 Tax=Acidocella sp. TaxID=50710 RepID=UPI002CA60B11|nr:LysR family transcriptional regulator [Acidocella sp.]HVE22914.1 LysR family transcriptional regulator [Acidocella sp.]